MPRVRPPHFASPSPRLTLPPLTFPHPTSFHVPSPGLPFPSFLQPPPPITSPCLPARSPTLYHLPLASFTLPRFPFALLPFTFSHLASPFPRLTSFLVPSSCLTLLRRTCHHVQSLCLTLTLPYLLSSLPPLLVPRLAVPSPAAFTLKLSLSSNFLYFSRASPALTLPYSLLTTSTLILSPIITLPYLPLATPPFTLPYTLVSLHHPFTSPSSYPLTFLYHPPASLLTFLPSVYLSSPSSTDVRVLNTPALPPLISPVISLPPQVPGSSTHLPSPSRAAPRTLR